MPFDRPDGAEKFQILSPVRMHAHGVYDLNRWIQFQFRKKSQRISQQYWVTNLGNEEIGKLDKVIQLKNEYRNAFDGRSTDPVYIANGEIGLVATDKNRYLNVLFAGRPDKTFGYSNRDFPGGSGPLELAYVLTIHKAQGSEFQKVFVILPKASRLISRELIYTALTRSRQQMVLLIEGDDVSQLYDLTRPEKSETARRNTNLFTTAIRVQIDEVPYAEHLIHRTTKGHMVRSKSELVIANMLYQMSLQYEYERQLEGIKEPGKLRPDFSFVDVSGDLIIWEHLGLLWRDDYRRAWDWKKNWYSKNGYVEGKNLFTTADDEKGGLDSNIIKQTAEKIKELM